VTKELADGFGLASPSGALINSVEKGGPAEKAGIEAGDVILRFDGKAVNASEDLPRIVGNTRPGRQVVVQLWRNKTAKEVRVTVSELSDDAVAGRGGRGGATPAPSASLYGMGISELSASQRKELKIEGGLLVGELQGSAVRAGIRRGDIILAVNNQDVKTVEMFTKIMSTFEKGQIVALLVRRGNNSLYLPFKIDSAN
jgi:serine protease Do